MSRYFLKSSLKNVHLRHIVPDICIIVFSIYASLYLRIGMKYAFIYVDDLHKFVPIILSLRLLVLVFSGAYSILWRYVSTSDVIELTRAIFVSSVMIVCISFFVPEEFARIPKSLYLIESVLTLLGLLGIRILRRIKFESRHVEQIRHGKRTLIVGAGYNGKTLADRFGYDVNEATRLVGFVDDDPAKQGLSIAGVRVLGTSEDLPEIIRKHDISQVIIAATQVSGDKIRSILQVTRPFNIRPRIISRRLSSESGQGDAILDREISLADLLNRPSKNVDLKSVNQMVKGRQVLVTGAGGSIGSEIARQILEQDPSRLLILDHSEYNLYKIDHELRASAADTNKVVPLLVDLKDRGTLFGHLREFNPEIVIHAAAYKHVHLVESNPYSAILNNVLGTKNVLEFSIENGVGTFVMISTDKAVNPAGVMGATKRVCEQMTSAAGCFLKRRYCSVRFGNVLGSSGSLIPLLKKQIREGGPVTVTHKDMTRYFMLIPEAVSLVLKAATIARFGDINVLRMGSPVKILDIAKNLITLMGRKEGEIEIMFTGLRPGEKMYEELYIRGDELQTEHPDILTLPDGDMDKLDGENSFENLFQHVDRMIALAQARDKEALYELNHLVKSTYVPPEDVHEESRKVSSIIGPRRKTLIN